MSKEHIDNVDAQDENKLIAARREKLDSIRERRVAFPNDFTPSASSEKLIAQHEAKDKETLEGESIQVSVAGRIVRMRGPFTVIQDGAAQMQLYMNNKSLPEELVEEFKALDLGDIIGVEGELFKTGKDELTVRVATFRLLTKSLRPLPDKFKGLTDTEMRYRQRYVDLIVNEESRRIF
jgi:lysyl-tRNA synthetase class 2